MYDVYSNNKFLKHIPVDNIKSKILSYIIKDDSLSYEIMGKERDFLFITGYNQEEKELPVFDHPILLESAMNRKYIAIDLRKYVKSLKEKPTMIIPELSNFSYGMFCINRAILTDMYLEDKSKLNIVQDPIAKVFAFIISTYIESLVPLTPKEKVLIEAASYIYMASMFLSDYSNDEKKVYFRTKLKGTVLSLPMLNENIDEVLNIRMDANKFEHLYDNICVLLGTKKNSISIQGFINSISNLWFGPGTVETTLMSLNDLPTAITLYVSAISDTSLKKSRISMIIDKYKRKIDLDKINKLKLNMKSYTL